MSSIVDSVMPWSKDDMKDYQWLDEILLKQKGTVREFQPAWQAYKYLLQNKMYAYVGVKDKEERPIITLKLEPMYSDMLRNKYDDIVPGYYMNKQHWSTVYLDSDVPRKIITDIVWASHEWVLSSFSKRIQQEILNE
jgi:Uncharacterized protein conserved in bacteria